MTETLTNPDTQPSELGGLLQRWQENPPPSLTQALSEEGLDAEALENYARSGITTDEVEMLRRVLVQAATSNPDDGALLARLTPVLDPRERAWDRMLRAKSTGEVLTATVTEAVKGGVVVDVGVRGFVPASQLGLSVPRNLNQFIGRSLKLRVLEVDRKRQTVILTNRQVMEEDRAEKKKQALGRLEEGQVRAGTVKRLTDIGAFVDVGGVDGLLHVSEISWKRVDHPQDVLKVGQKVQVKVLRLDPEQGRISLSMRRLNADPWEDARTKYAPGNVVKTKIASLVPQGAVVELDEQVEGFIPISELSERRISTPEEAVQVGQEVEALVIDFRPRERRIVLSLRKLVQKRERQEIDTYQKKTRRTSERTTLGDLFGHLFEEYKHQSEDEEAEQGATAIATEDEGPEEGTTPPHGDALVSHEDLVGDVSEESGDEAETAAAQTEDEPEMAAVQAEDEAVVEEAVADEPTGETDAGSEEEVGAVETDAAADNIVAEDESGSVVAAAVGDEVDARSSEAAGPDESEAPAVEARLDEAANAPTEDEEEAQQPG